jgi:hypothetical protein
LFRRFSLLPLSLPSILIRHFAVDFSIRLSTDFDIELMFLSRQLMPMPLSLMPAMPLILRRHARRLIRLSLTPRRPPACSMPLSPILR